MGEIRKLKTTAPLRTILSRWITLCALAFFALKPLGSTLKAGGLEGSSPFAFLLLDTGARPVALGGAHVGVSGNVNSLLYNPAGLSNISSQEATFMHNIYFQGVSQQYLAYVHPKSIGVSVNYLSYGNLDRTTLSNPRGIGLSSFGISDIALSVGYGKEVKENLSLGAGLKIIRETIDNFSASALALDLGVHYQTPLDGFAVGFILQNLGTKVKFQSQTEELPLNLKTGLSYQFIESGILVLDINQPIAGKTTFHVGGEYTLMNLLPLRIGYNGRNDTDSGITAGIGIAYNAFSIDYAFVPFGALGSAHRFSLTVQW